MDGMAPLQIADLEGRDSDDFGAQVGERVRESIEVLGRGEDGEVGVAAKLGGAVENACLAAHQEALDFVLPKGRKDSGDRARGQARLPAR
jgi:hypothetical protein